MSRLEELIQHLCPNGVEFKPIKEVYQRLKGTPITAGKMKEIESKYGIFVSLQVVKLLSMRTKKIFQMPISQEFQQFLFNPVV